MALDSLGKAPRKSNKRRVTLQELEGMTFKHKVDVCTSFKMSHGVNFKKLKTPQNFRHGLLSLLYTKSIGIQAYWGTVPYTSWCMVKTLQVNVCAATRQTGFSDETVFTF